MTIYTIGFGKKNAKTFFSALRENQIEVLVDIRLNNKSQLAGFTKDGDIQFFLNELCGIEYYHAENLAPTKELLSGYQNKKISWDQYVDIFTQLMIHRNAYTDFIHKYSKYKKVCLLCSEPTPEKCHRRLVAEMIAGKNAEVHIIHL